MRTTIGCTNVQLVIASLTQKRSHAVTSSGGLSHGLPKEAAKPRIDGLYDPIWMCALYDQQTFAGQNRPPLLAKAEAPLFLRESMRLVGGAACPKICQCHCVHARVTSNANRPICLGHGRRGGGDLTSSHVYLLGTSKNYPLPGSGIEHLRLGRAYRAQTNRYGASHLYIR
jgi:hypothetical protein